MSYLVSDRNKIIKFSVKNACNFFGEIFSFKITTILHKIIEYDICYLEELNHLTPLNIKRVFRGIGIFWCNYIKMEKNTENGVNPMMAGIKYFPNMISQSISDWIEKSTKKYITQYMEHNSLEENEKILLNDEIEQFKDYIKEELGDENSIVFDNENVNNYLSDDVHKDKLPVIKLKIEYIENRRNALIKVIQKNKSIFVHIDDEEFKRATESTQKRFGKLPPMSKKGVTNLVEQVSNSDNYKDVSNIFFMARLIDIYSKRGTTTMKKDVYDEIVKNNTAYEINNDSKRITVNKNPPVGSKHTLVGPDGKTLIFVEEGGKRYRSTKRRSKRRSKRKQKRTQKRRASRRR